MGKYLLSEITGGASASSASIKLLYVAPEGEHLQHVGQHWDMEELQKRMDKIAASWSRTMECYSSTIRAEHFPNIIFEIRTAKGARIARVVYRYYYQALPVKDREKASK